MAFDGRLEKGFVLGKPIKPEDYEESILYALEKQGRLLKTRKLDGWKLFVTWDAKGRVRIYTDGMNEVDEKLAHIKDEMRALGLRNACIVGEGTVLVGAQKDDFTLVASIMKSNAAKSVATQARVGTLKFRAFNWIFNEGKPVTTPYGQTYRDLTNLFAGCQDSDVVPLLLRSYDECKKLVSEQGWEGLVLYDSDFVITHRTDGKNPQRPKGSYKWKPIMEDDFIVRRAVPREDGTGVKELVLTQIDPKTKEEFYCGKIGAFTKAMRAHLAVAKYPFVVQVRYELRFPKTGKLRHPRFMRLRPDKKLGECVAPARYAERVADK